jgi:hypothetical protein
MKTALISLLILFLALSFGRAQSRAYLAYNPTNFAVYGWTNADPLRFTNSIKLGGELGYPVALPARVDLQVFGYVTVAAHSAPGEEGGRINVENTGGVNGVIIAGKNTSTNVIEISADEIKFNAAASATQANLFTTNTAPSNTTNVVRWISITVSVSGTNQTFRIPLYQ